MKGNERSLVNRLGRAIHKATSVWVIVIYSVFYLLTSREVLSSLQGVISYDMWVRHTPPLYSSILSFFFFNAKDIYFSRLAASCLLLPYVPAARLPLYPTRTSFPSTCLVRDSLSHLMLFKEGRLFPACIQFVTFFCPWGIYISTIFPQNGLLLL